MGREERRKVEMTHSTVMQPRALTAGPGEEREPAVAGISFAWEEQRLWGTAQQS